MKYRDVIKLQHVRQLSIISFKKFLNMSFKIRSERPGVDRQCNVFQDVEMKGHFGVWEHKQYLAPTIIK